MIAIGVVVSIAVVVGGVELWHWYEAFGFILLEVIINQVYSRKVLK